MTATNKLVRMEDRAGKYASAGCLAVNELMDLIRDKWTLLVLGALRRHDSLRYNELQRAVHGISQRMLTLTLKGLEENGLVKRTLFPAVPPRVDYELTDMGRSLITPLRALLDWTNENREAMRHARAAYARKKTG